MSLGLFRDDVKFLQRFLKSAGFDPGPIDGLYGSLTDGAVQAFDALSEQIAAEQGRFTDGRTERCLRSLHPKAQRAARSFLKRVRDAGLDARILSGTRTYAEQNALYRKGRYGNPGPIVTNARGGRSNHNFGIAWDIGVFRNGAYLQDAAPYHKAAEIGLDETLEWGGNWVSFKDRPHYQLAINKELAEVRESFEEGVVFV